MSQPSRAEHLAWCKARLKPCVQGFGVSDSVKWLHGDKPTHSARRVGFSGDRGPAASLNHFEQQHNRRRRMRIKKIISQHRSDYRAEMVCEHCNAEAIDLYGYNDANYHERVIPAMHCKACGKNRAGVARVDKASA